MRQLAFLRRIKTPRSYEIQGVAETRPRETPCDSRSRSRDPNNTISEYSWGVFVRLKTTLDSNSAVDRPATEPVSSKPVGRRKARDVAGAAVLALAEG